MPNPARPRSKWKCLSCGYTWEGYRVLWHPIHKVKMRFDAPDDYGPTECALEPWAHIYVEWVNWEEIRKSLGNYWER